MIALALGIALVGLGVLATFGACWIAGDQATRKNDLGTLNDANHHHDNNR